MRLVEGDQSAHLRRMLQPGEQLLWEGRPAPGVHLQPGDGFMIPFSEHRGTKFVTYRQIPTLEKHVKSNGEGTVYLSEPRGYYSRGSYRRDDQNRTALVNIPDAERVYWLIEANMLQESQE